LALGFDAIIDNAGSDIAEDGEVACEHVAGECYTFPNGLDYETLTLLFTLWGKPYLQIADLRVWGGPGINFALVMSNYLASSAEGVGYGSNSDTAFSISLGAGVDYRVPLGGRTSLVVSLGIALGSPVYDERMDPFIADGNVLDRQGVAHAVNPTRAFLGVGFGMMPPSAATE
jgi:hypothetical protein